jgi:hypothetical protein
MELAPNNVSAFCPVRHDVRPRGSPECDTRTSAWWGAGEAPTPESRKCALANRGELTGSFRAAGLPRAPHGMNDAGSAVSLRTLMARGRGVTSALVRKSPANFSLRHHTPQKSGPCPARDLLASLFCVGGTAGDTVSYPQPDTSETGPSNSPIPRKVPVIKVLSRRPPQPSRSSPRAGFGHLLRLHLSCRTWHSFSGVP